MAKAEGNPEFDPMKGLQSLLEAASMLRGAQFRKKLTAPKKDGGLATGEQPKGRIAIKNESGSPKSASIDAKEGTAEWHAQVVQGLIKGELPPEIKVAEKVQAARQALQAPSAQSEVKYLLGDGVPKNDVVVTVAADIASSSFKDDPKYLLAKQSQLFFSIRPDMAAADQAEVIRACTRINMRILTLPTKAPDAEIRDISSRLIFNEHAARNTQNIRAEGSNLSNAADEVENDEAESEELKNERVTVQKAISEKAGSDPMIAQKLEELHIPDDAAAFLQAKIEAGMPINEALKEYAKSVRTRRGLTQPEYRRTAKFLVDTGSIIGDRSAADSMSIRGAAGPVIWDTATMGGSASPAMRRALEQIQFKFDENPYYSSDMHEISRDINSLSSFSAAELAGVGDPQKKLVNELNRIQNERLKRERGSSIEEPHSTLYLETEMRKSAVLFLDFAYAKEYASLNDKITFFAEGPFAETMETELRQISGLVTGKAFENNIIEVLNNPKYRALVDKAMGVTDPNIIPTEHPFYKNRTEEFEKLGSYINAQENTIRTFGAHKFGLEGAKIAQQAGTLGDSALFTMQMDNGGLNGVAYHLWDAMGDDLGVYDDFDGSRVRTGEREIEYISGKVFETMRANRAQLEIEYKKYWYKKLGIREDIPEAREAFEQLQVELGMSSIEKFELTDDVLKSIVKNGEKLFTVTLREHKMRARALAPGDGQRGAKYGAEEGPYILLRGRRPIGFWAERWDLLSGTGRLHLRVMCDEYAKSFNIGDEIDTWIANSKNDASYRQELAEYALNISSKNPDKQKAAVKNGLDYHFSVDLRGYTSKSPSSEIKTVTDLVKLSDAQLKQILMYREGAKLGDTILGSYDYEGASWVAVEHIDQADRVYKDAPVMLADKKRMVGIHKLLSVESDHALHDGQHDMVNGHDDYGGILRQMAERMPHRHFQDLMEHHDYDTRKFFHKQVADGKYIGMFQEKMADGSLRNLDVTNKRPDIAYKGLKKVYTMTEELIAFKDGKISIDYSKPIPIGSIEDTMLTSVCDALNVDKPKYLAVMREMADFTGEKLQLQKLVQPTMFDTYMATQDLDARRKYGDNPLDAPGSLYTKDKDRNTGALSDRLETAVSAKVIDKVSGHVGGYKGKGNVSGVGRVTGDNNTGSESAKLLAGGAGPKILGARDTKVLQELASKFTDGVLFTYGTQTKGRAFSATYGSWAICAKMDAGKDWGMVGSLFEDLPSSPFQRVGEFGEHGDASLTVNELHGYWTTMQRAADVTLKTDAAALNAHMEEQLGLIWQLQIGNWHRHTYLPYYIYRYYLPTLGAGVGVVVGLLGTFFSTLFGQGEGGGGSTPHHPG